MDENKKENTANQNNSFNKNQHNNNTGRHEDRNCDENGQHGEEGYGKDEETLREEVTGQREFAAGEAAEVPNDAEDALSEDIPDDGVDDNLSAEELAAIMKL